MDLFGEDIAETLPVSDEEEAGLKEPRFSSFCLGHGVFEKSFLKNFAAGKVPHALIFSGRKGIGKSTMAFRVARFLLKYGSRDAAPESLFAEPSSPLPESLDLDQNDPVFRRVASGGHADLLYVGRSVDERKGKLKNGVDIEAARKIVPFLRLNASGGGWRVVIIDDADTMNRNAQNAILKILEEPPAQTLLILVAHRAGALIPTIRSRAQLMHFSSLSEKSLRELLFKHSPDLSEVHRKRLVQLADGSIGEALRLLEQGGLEIFEQTGQLLEKAPQWDWVSIHSLADELCRPGAEDSFLAFQEIIQGMMRKVLHAKARGQAFPDWVAGPFEHMINHSSLAALSKTCESLQDHFIQVNKANLEKRQAVMGAFSIIA